MKQKYYLVLNDQEHRLIIESLNQLRNKLIADGKYTDAVDEVLLKIISAKQKKFKVFYHNLLTSGKLNGYLSDLDKQAEDMFSRLVKQMAEREGVTERLKAENQMEWVRQMNNLRSRASEIINSNLINTI